MGGAKLQMNRIRAGVQVVHDYDVCVEVMHFSEGNKMQISLNQGRDVETRLISKTSIT